MKYIIIGGGWYGNFLGLILKTLNIDFIILEKNKDIFGGSSSKNQNRLHQGFHYPKSKSTRDECILGYDLFIKLFGFVLSDVSFNYYLIEKNSNVLFNDYVNIYKNHNLDFDIINNIDIGINMDNIDGIIKCNEKLINHNIAYNYFKKHLIDHTILNYDINKLDIDNCMYDNVVYDKIINCSYGQFYINDCNEYEYELCICLIYKSDIDVALTMMDGPYFSIYPYIKGSYTITDVEYTPIYKSNKFENIIKYESNINVDEIMIIKNKIETKVKKYLLNFDELFVYESYNLSYKCKFKNNVGDDRSVRIYEDSHICNCVGGKITGIFGMASYLFDKDTLNIVYDKISKNNMNL